MKFHLGAELRRPTIAATLDSEDVSRLQAVPPLNAALKAGLVAVTEHTTDAEYTFLLRKIGRQTPVKQQASVRTVAEVLSLLSGTLPEDPADALQDVYVGTDRRGADGRLLLGMSLVWPQTAPSAVASFATTVMQKVGTYVGYPKKLGMPAGIYEESVYADLNRPHGVTLQTLPIGSCSIDTDGNEYKPNASRFNLYQHNLYDHRQQLMCLAGAIAIAQADEVLAT